VGSGFEVVLELLGPGGENLNAIQEQTGCQMTLGGRGSGEGREQREAATAAMPLMLLISAPDGSRYDLAVELAKDLFLGVLTRYNTVRNSQAYASNARPTFASTLCSLRGRELPRDDNNVFRCQLLVGLEEAEGHGFQVMTRLLGIGCRNIKFVQKQTGARLTVKGGGASGSEQPGACEPLVLAVSAPDGASYNGAVDLAWAMIEGIHAEYRAFLDGRGCPAPRGPRVRLHGACRW